MEGRISSLNNQEIVGGDCVVYLMSRDQRVHDNHALLRAQDLAKEKDSKIVVAFNVLSKTGERAKEHYEFMLEGLKAIEAELDKYNIGFTLLFEDNHKSLLNEINKLNPSALVFDFSPLNGPKELKNFIAKNAKYYVEVVDAHNIIPTWIASDKEEFAAHTFRGKVHKHLDEWLIEPDKISKLSEKFSIAADWKQFQKIVDAQKSNGIKIEFQSGEKHAQKELKDFIENRLDDYAKNRNNPNIDGQSDLSPYLHFGQISSLRISLELTKNHTPLLIKEAKLAKYEGEPTVNDSIDAFLEELIVRKELADNYCNNNTNYKNYNGIKDWAKKTLEEHIHDKREYEYDLEELQSCKTHDDAWNAAQAQLQKTGKMHGYMRMYWAKKILEWSPNPKTAIDHANYLNDHYSIDGGDPNGYVGVLWSIGGLHDRPWFEQPIFGKIRYMNYNGLKNKFDIEAYAKKWLS
jgi:deoxyribodipyrimidine photo-lyase